MALTGLLPVHHTALYAHSGKDGCPKSRKWLLGHLIFFAPSSSPKRRSFSPSANPETSFASSIIKNPLLLSPPLSPKKNYTFFDHICTPVNIYRTQMTLRRVISHFWNSNGPHSRYWPEKHPESSLFRGITSLESETLLQSRNIRK
jgi:hypothetical protein